MTNATLTPAQRADLILATHQAKHGRRDECRANLERLEASNTDPEIDCKLAATFFWIGDEDASRRLLERAYTRGQAEVVRKAGRKKAA